MEMLKGSMFLFPFPRDNTNSRSNEKLLSPFHACVHCPPKTFTQLGSVNISKSAAASPGTGSPHAHTSPTARLPGPYLCRMALMTWCAPSPWYSQVCWLLRTKSLIFTFWLPMYLWKSRIFNCLNSSKLSTPAGREEKLADPGAGNSPRHPVLARSTSCRNCFPQTNPTPGLPPCPPQAAPRPRSIMDPDYTPASS